MKGLQLIATGGALPGRLVTNEDLSKLADTSDEWIRTRTGIRERHLFDASRDGKFVNGSTVSAAVAAGERALSMAEARRARGESFISHPLRSLCQLSISILSDLLDKAEVYIDALYSRGYDASARRGAMPYRACDYVLIAMCIASLSIMAAEEVL